MVQTFTTNSGMSDHELSFQNKHNALTLYQRRTYLFSLLILLTWFHLSYLIAGEDSELQFIERIYMVIRASCFASIPLLGNMFVIPILILVVEKCQKRLNLIEDKQQYEQFLDTNIGLIRDHFHCVLLFVLNVSSLAVLDNNQLECFQGKIVAVTCLFFAARFLHIFETIQALPLNLKSKDYTSHLISMGENATTQINAFLFIINLCLRYNDFSVFQNM